MVSRNAVVAAVTSTGLISLPPNILLILLPEYAEGEGEHNPVLAMGQALAAGGLLGDVFLHTIPHAEGKPDVGFRVLLGFSIFLITDMILRTLGWHDRHKHSHRDTRKAYFEIDKNRQPHAQDRKLSVVALILAADALRNFTDGLAVGASFSVSNVGDDASVLSILKSKGGIATLSILVHEIVHELGDFAVLVRNGFSKNQAIVAQFGTACAGMLGTVAGILLEGDADSDHLIFTTAGGFLYLAASAILPDMVEKSVSARLRLAQILCFAAGVSFVIAIADHGHSGDHDRNEHQLELFQEQLVPHVATLECPESVTLPSIDNTRPKVSRKKGLLDPLRSLGRRARDQ